MAYYSTDTIIEHTDKYYYFPTMTKNIMFVRGEKYICLSDNIGRMIKGKIYIVDDFVNGNVLLSIDFKDEFGKIYSISPFNCGSFVSLKKQRKDKLKKLKKLSQYD